MCGIFGVVSPRAPVDLQAVARASASLAHRGPDGRGLLIDGPAGRRLVLEADAPSATAAHVVLAHRRLAIIDLVTGQQPLANEAQDVWCMLNGEIYNYRELRRELAALGHSFRTASDTEVLCHAFEEWGDDLVDRLNGMFAFCVYDARASRLVLFRDPLGIKPLVYAEGPGYFAFGSEVKALLRFDPRIRVDRDSVFDFFVHDQIPPPRTAFVGLRRLGAGQRLSVDCRSASARPPETYWRVCFAVRQRDEADVLAEVQATLEQAVDRQRVADVPVGTFLSGGIDSSLVTRELLRFGPVKAIHLHSDDATSEQRWAMHRGFAGVERVNIRFEPRLDDVLLALRQIDDPLRDASLLPTAIVSRAAAANGLKVVLSGDGGDENFAGYDTIFYPALLYERLAPWGVRSWGRSRLPLALFGLVSGVGADAREALRGYARAGGCLPGQAELEINNLISARKREAGSVPDFRTPLLATASAADPDARLDALLELYYRFFLNVVLAKVDFASMTSSLEVRVPLLDVELVRLALTIPFAFKVRRRGKYPLKAIAARLFGEDFAYRAKSAFNVDYAALFRDAAIAGHLRDRLRQPGLDEFLDVAGVLRLLPEAERGRQGKRLWRALMFAEWYANFGAAHA